MLPKIPKTLIVLMFVVGIVHILPHLFYAHDFTEMNLFGANELIFDSVMDPDQRHYLSNINDVYYENEDWVTFATLPLLLTGHIGSGLGIKLKSLITGLHFLMLFLYVALFYYLALLMTESPRGSILIAALTLLFPSPQLIRAIRKLYVINTPSYFLRSLFYPEFHFVPALPLNRIVNPCYTYIIVITCLIFFYRTVENPASYRNFVYLGISLGLSIYFYIFYWTYLLAVMFVLTTIFMLYKEKETVKKYFLSVSISLSISSYFLYLVYKMILGAGKRDGHANVGVGGHSNAPIIDNLHYVIAVLILLFIWLVYKRIIKKNTGVFSIALLAAYPICMNQQIITGTLFQQNHYPNYIFPPLFMFVLGIVLLSLG